MDLNLQRVADGGIATGITLLNGLRRARRKALCLVALDGISTRYPRSMYRISYLRLCTVEWMHCIKQGGTAV